MSEDFFYHLAETQSDLIHNVYDKIDDKILDTIKTTITFLTLNFGIGYYLIGSNLSFLAAIFQIIGVILMSYSLLIGISNRVPLDLDFLDPYEFYINNFDKELIEIQDTLKLEDDY